MPTTSAIASELRRIADMFEKNPDIDMVQPRLSFYFGCSDTKEKFLDLAKIFPRPLKKGDGFSHDQYTLTHKTEALEVYASIDRSKVCTLVEKARPARYTCVPLLSLEEESALGDS
jgi:hypothetical protein